MGRNWMTTAKFDDSRRIDCVEVDTVYQATAYKERLLHLRQSDSSLQKFRKRYIVSCGFLGGFRKTPIFWWPNHPNVGKYRK